MSVNGKTFIFLFGTLFLAVVFANLSLQYLAKRQAANAAVAPKA